MQGTFNKQEGFAALIVLVAVAIVMILYATQMGVLFGPSGTFEPKGLEDHPWVLEELLISADEDVKLPRKPKLQLYEPLHTTAAVRRNESPRGTLTIEFGTNGRIRGQWDCVYTSDGQDYRIISEMSGNIDVQRTFRNEQGKDKSRLFFIARGPYTKSQPQPHSDRPEERGTAWLTGWVGPDGNTAGHVTITTNREWAAAYDFEGGK